MFLIALSPNYQQIPGKTTLNQSATATDHKLRVAKELSRINP
jgi:hypothetical protein